MSRAFSFRLARVLDVRESAEARAQEQLAAALAARRTGWERMDGAERTLVAARDAARTAAGDPTVGGTDLIAHQAFLERATLALRAAQLELDRLDAEADGRRAALAAAVRERQVLERLKDRQHAEWRLARGRVEAAALDEMALAVHRRREAAL